MLDYLKALDFEPKLDIREEFLPDENNAVTFNREENVYVVNTAYEEEKPSRRFVSTSMINVAWAVRKRVQNENPSLLLFGRKTLSKGTLSGIDHAFSISGSDEEIDAEIVSRLIGYIHRCRGTDSEKKETLLMSAPDIKEKYETDFLISALVITRRVN